MTPPDTRNYWPALDSQAGREYTISYMPGRICPEYYVMNSGMPGCKLQQLGFCWPTNAAITQEAGDGFIPVKEEDICSEGKVVVVKRVEKNVYVPMVK